MTEEEKLALDYSYKVEPFMDVGIDNGISVYCRQDVEQAYLYGYLAGAKDNTQQWHKVAAGDLPKETGDYITNIGVLTYDLYGDDVFRWHTPFCEACDYSDVVDDEVIAWCEIPKCNLSKLEE